MLHGASAFSARGEYWLYSPLVGSRQTKGEARRLPERGVLPAFLAQVFPSHRIVLRLRLGLCDSPARGEYWLARAPPLWRSFATRTPPRGESIGCTSPLWGSRQTKGEARRLPERGVLPAFLAQVFPSHRIVLRLRLGLCDSPARGEYWLARAPPLWRSFATPPLPRGERHDGTRANASLTLLCAEKSRRESM